MKKTIFFLISFTCLIFYGQQDNIDRPNDEEETKEKIHSIISKESDKNIELIDYKKVDRVNSKKTNINYYTLEFKGNIKFLKDGYFRNMYYEKNTTKGFLKFNVGEPYISPNRNVYTFVKAGDLFPIVGTIEYIKKENKWSIKNILILPQINKK